MKFHAPRPFALALALTIALPASAQTQSQLKQENERLKTQLQELQVRCNAGPQQAGMQWQQGSLEARLDSIRLGSPYPKRVQITVTITLHNTSAEPMIVNYQGGSWVATDSNGYQYETHLEGDAKYGTVKGIPVASNTRADTSAKIAPGGTRTITISAQRNMKNGQTIGNRLDLNATFIQFEDLGQGRIRKVRDYPVAFTNVSASGLGLTSGSPADTAYTVAGQVDGHRMTQVIK